MKRLVATTAFLLVLPIMASLTACAPAGGNADLATFSLLAGFILMMILDSVI